MSNNLIIGAIDLYTEWSKVAPWAISAREQHDGDIVMLTYRTTPEIINNLQKLAIDVYPISWDSFGRPLQYHDQLTSVHELRFFHFWQFLQDKNYEMVVSTDVRDVVFQMNPFQYIEEYSLLFERLLIASAESLTYENEYWGAENMKQGYGNYWYEQMKDEMIYNVGVLAGYADKFSQLCATIYSMTEGRYHPSDQSSYSILVNKLCSEWFTKVDHDVAWACQAGTTLDEYKMHYGPKLTTKRPKIIDGIAHTNDGKKFCIFHQFDRTPVAQLIAQKYE